MIGKRRKKRSTGIFRKIEKKLKEKGCSTLIVFRSRKNSDNLIIRRKDIKPFSDEEKRAINFIFQTPDRDYPKHFASFTISIRLAMERFEQIKKYSEEG